MNEADWPLPQRTGNLMDWGLNEHICVPTLQNLRKMGAQRRGVISKPYTLFFKFYNKNQNILPCSWCFISLGLPAHNNITSAKQKSHWCENFRFEVCCLHIQTPRLALIHSFALIQPTFFFYMLGNVMLGTVDTKLRSVSILQVHTV